MDITESVEERLLQITESENGMCLEKLGSTFVIGFSDDQSNDEGIVFVFFFLYNLSIFYIQHLVFE